MLQEFRKILVFLTEHGIFFTKTRNRVRVLGQRRKSESLKFQRLGL